MLSPDTSVEGVSFQAPLTLLLPETRDQRAALGVGAVVRLFNRPLAWLCLAIIPKCDLHPTRIGQAVRGVRSGTHKGQDECRNSCLTQVIEEGGSLGFKLNLLTNYRPGRTAEFGDVPLCVCGELLN